jgi:hypothetical protein
MPTRYFAFCFFLLAVCPFTGAAGTLFVVLDNEENNVIGTITALDKTRIVLDVQGESIAIPLDKLVKIRNLAPNPYGGTSAATTGYQNLLQQIAPSLRNPAERKRYEDIAKQLQSSEQAAKKTFPNNVIALDLKDGSRLIATSFSVGKSQGVCRLLDQKSDVSLPLDALSSVRFTVRSLPEVLTPPADWLRLATPQQGGDRIVVGNPGSFDVHNGILHDITAETISFAVDGEVLPVARRRVFGLILHGEVPGAAVSPLASLSLWTGTRGMISDIRLDDDGEELTWQTSTGLTVVTPLDAVSEIDFGEKGVYCLLDFERVRSEFSLPFESNIKPAQLRPLQTFYESRANNSPSETVLDGVAYSRGVTMLGKTTLEYRLPKPFVAFKAVIGVEDQFRPNASANLQIVADSQVLGTWELRGDAPSQRIHLNLPQNCRLITITAEPSSPNVPVVLTIADPKVFE